MGPGTPAAHGAWGRRDTTSNTEWRHDERRERQEEGGPVAGLSRVFKRNAAVRRGPPGDYLGALRAVGPGAQQDYECLFCNRGPATPSPASYGRRGSPPEVHDLAVRLLAAGLDPDR